MEHISQNTISIGYRRRGKSIGSKCCHTKVGKSQKRPSTAIAWRWIVCKRKALPFPTVLYSNNGTLKYVTLDAFGTIGSIHINFTKKCRFIPTQSTIFVQCSKSIIHLMIDTHPRKGSICTMWSRREQLKPHTQYRNTQKIQLLLIHPHCGRPSIPSINHSLCPIYCCRIRNWDHNLVRQFKEAPVATTVKWSNLFFVSLLRIVNLRRPTNIDLLTPIVRQSVLYTSEHEAGQLLSEIHIAAQMEIL